MGISLINTPENFSGGKIANFMPVWESFTSDSWILTQVQGVQLDCGADLSLVQDKSEISFLPEEDRLVADEIQSLLQKGVIREVTAVPGQVLSNVFLREKKDGSFRMILNLKNLKARSHWPMDTKRMQKDTADEQNFGGGSIHFNPLKKWGKNSRKQNGKERTWVVCSGDVKRMFIGNLADESGCPF